MERIDLYVDGECALCAASVKFLNKGIKTDYLVVVHHIQTSQVELPKVVRSLESVGMHYKNQWHHQWRAVRLILSLKPGLKFGILRLLAKLTPLFLGNNIYRIISRNRFSISKKISSPQCLLQSEFYPNNPKSRLQLSSNIETKKRVER